MTGPNTWVLRYQVFRETGLYDGFSVTGRTELFFPSIRNLQGRKSRPGNSAGLLLRGSFRIIAERVWTVFSGDDIDGGVFQCLSARSDGTLLFYTLLFFPTMAFLVHIVTLQTFEKRKICTGSYF